MSNIDDNRFHLSIKRCDFEFRKRLLKKKSELTDTLI